MKLSSIQPENELNRNIEGLSQQEIRKSAGVNLEVLERGLSKMMRRGQAARRLESMLSDFIPPLFAAVTEDKVMRTADTVNEEITTAHAEDAKPQSPPENCS